MNILVLNGSPKGENSNTLALTNAFLSGINRQDDNIVEIVNLKQKRIEHCLGCFCCWTKTPGQCVIKDDMDELLKKYISADVIVWSFPLYYYSMPSKIKAFMDRLLPTNLPFMPKEDNVGGGHPLRFDLSHQKYVLISTCGFYKVEHNYDGLVKQFEILYGDKLTKIICSEGELIGKPQLKTRINEYFSYAEDAGAEYAKSGSITETTKANLEELLYPVDRFIQMADASWEINETESGLKSGNIEQDKSLKFITQMAAIYDQSHWDGKDVVIEMNFTDLDKTYQLKLGEQDCKVVTENFTQYNTRIETSFDIWKEISDGKISGTVALMEKKYRVLGELGVMTKMDDYFSASNNNESEKAPSSSKKTNMLVLLLPWIALWSLVPINPLIGGAVVILLASMVSIVSTKFSITTYDRLGALVVSSLGLLAVFEIQISFVVVASYLAFGLLWLVSLAFEIPLTAYYSNKAHGGNKAFSNPLFMKTNWILTLLWGVVYILISVIAYFLFGTEVSKFTGLICSGGSAVMGIFTAWFSKWYPSKLAKG